MSWFWRTSGRWTPVEVRPVRPRAPRSREIATRSVLPAPRGRWDRWDTRLRRALLERRGRRALADFPPARIPAQRRPPAGRTP